MKDYPDVTGWYLARGRILREPMLATEAPNWTAKVTAGTFKAVSFDAIPASLDNIKAGYVNAVINQKYFGWGYDVVTLTYDVLTNGRKVPTFTDSQLTVLRKQYRSSWRDVDISRLSHRDPEVFPFALTARAG